MAKKTRKKAAAKAAKKSKARKRVAKKKTAAAKKARKVAARKKSKPVAKKKLVRKKIRKPPPESFAQDKVEDVIHRDCRHLHRRRAAASETGSRHIARTGIAPRFDRKTRGAEAGRLERLRDQTILCENAGSNRI